ncbi:MAG: Stp1/IreP family PP2C-type Ser/Thr phosphatase [Crocinitomicaceae bacterium]|nr:Stp1/IreP family PP2C-type Ser/Thr phosphatase [Crocinitomicaceae bacterium]MCF8433527.1 Stp1/IreP family PP2C-type Ser/Thr phosphatase [Crocinitomicaceae bacterium]
MKYISKSLTNVGKVRSANEDNLGEAKTPNGDLFVVCDGMGGHVGGAQASTIAVNSLIEYFQREVYDNVIQAIDHALSFANEQIYASALSNPDLKGMGTTAVVLLVRGEECFVGHVGDSRIYLRSNGKLNRITKDHSFVQTLVDSGVIDDEDAENHPNKNQILQALGIAPAVKATICQSPILPKAGDMFLLCSDGLNGMVNDRDMERIMQEDNLMVTSENLITAALNGGGHDNITASLVLIEESAHNSSRFVHFNPKPKVIDMSSTQQFGGGATAAVHKKSKLPYIIGGGTALLGGALAIIMLMMKDEVPDESQKILTKEDLKTYVCQNMNDITKDMKVDFAADTITNSQCEGTNHIFIIEDSTIVEIKTEIINKPMKSDDAEPEEEINVPAPKKIKNMSKQEITSLQVGASVADEKGDFEAHGYKISVDKNKVKSKDKVKVENLSVNILRNHTVKASQGLDAIVQLYISKCPKLNKESLINHNVDNNTKLKSSDKQTLNQGKTIEGMVLEIPCD